MSALRTAIFVVWGVFWLYWLISAAGAKESSRQGTRARAIRPVTLLVVVVAAAAIRQLRLSGGDSLNVHSVGLEILGTIVFLSGLAFAVWARIHLGRNWGMPMTERAEPELVTSGPYRYVRHPIYSGILLALLGTALALNPYYLIALVVVAGYFIYSATVEERTMTASFPEAYPKYKAHTKMLIPFVL